MPFPFFRTRIIGPTSPIGPIKTKEQELECPSFNDEPWKSKAERLRPNSLDEYILADVNDPIVAEYKPLPPGHRYVRLVLKFLETVPDHCWIDEENEVD